MRLYYGGYGHNPRSSQHVGQYVYWGGDNYRTGQNVVVPVTNKNGKTYNTMFTIQMTSGAESSWVDKQDQLNMAQREAQRLEGEGINIKSIEGTDVMELPGAEDYTGKGQWARESRENWLNEARNRLDSYSASGNSESARNRLLGE